MRRAIVLVAVVLGGCAGGTPSADLFVVNRTGSLPGATLELHVSDGGYVSCNGGPQRQISSEQLLDARSILHELRGDDEKGRDEGQDGPIDEGLRLPPRPNSILRYELRGEDGRVAFSDTSAGQPQVFYEIAKFTRDMAKGVCGLPR